jgi:hypothetical protein
VIILVNYSLFHLSDVEIWVGTRYDCIELLVAEHRQPLWLDNL